jgi:hypothetical protein
VTPCDGCRRLELRCQWLESELESARRATKAALHCWDVEKARRVELEERLAELAQARGDAVVPRA